MSNVKPNSLTPTQKNLVKASQEETNPLFGIYLGVVKEVSEISFTGKLKVFIPALDKDPENPDHWRPCSWSSPFAGSTPVAGTGKNVEKYEETLKSYGLWMVPPDIGNTVLVAFGNGDEKNAFVIGCVFPGQFNYMIPGMPKGKSYADSSLELPVAEKNIKDERIDHNGKQVVRPVAPYLAEKIVKQGLINDPKRGPGTAGARRESPSNVFGILTPGAYKAGSYAKSTPVNSHRVSGHQFIMDDNPGSSMIRLRTGQGTQLLLDDSSGSIYMINRDGTAWFEMNHLGDVNVYGQGSLNIRTKGNLNLRADKNINIEAGNDINMRAAGDNVGEEYLGPNPAASAGGPPLGTGGAIRMDAAGDIQQFAALNYAATAAGGGINLSGANDVVIGSTKNIALTTTFGNLILDTTFGGASVSAGGGIGLHSTFSPVGIIGTLINLNSGPGFFEPPPLVSTVAPIGLNERKDQPSAPPEFDLDAALEGKAAVKNKGQRSGKADTIKTIVTQLITAEPYAGHYNGEDIAKEDPTAKGADESVTADTPPAASSSDGKPDDVQTPAGSKAGEGYVDSNGNTVSKPNNAPSVAARARRAVAAKQAAAGSAVNKLNKEAAKANAELSELRNKIPTYADIQNAFNDFGRAVEKKIDEVLGLSAFVASIKAMVPPVRFPTVNALQQKVIASIKQLKELEAQLKQFSLDKFGLPIDLNIPAIQDMKNQINGVMAQAKDGLDAVNRLKELGIEVTSDAGSVIYTDSLGNTLVDFTNGVGPIASSLAVQSEISKTYNNIKNAINVPISNNQAQALASFAKDIGEENFRNSNVLRALNEGRYNEVPRLMMQWSLGPEAGSTLPTPTSQLVYRQDYNDMRYFQGQIFQSPDNLDISPPSGTLDGELNARQLAEIIKARREEFNAANYVGPTEYYAGPGR